MGCRLRLVRLGQDVEEERAREANIEDDEL